MIDPAGSSRIQFLKLPPCVVLCALLLAILPSISGQVPPVEIKDPQLKAIEQVYLPQLITLHQAITEMKFPFAFSLNRHVGLDPKDQIAADARGLEFVDFHNRKVLKCTGNYNAAFNTDALTSNQRANRVLGEVILPILRLLPAHFNADASFDAFGFEIGYHVRRHASSYDYEGKEILVVVFNKPDGLGYANLREDAARQEILNRSEIFINGAPWGLALNSAEPFAIEALIRRPVPDATPQSKGVPINDAMTVQKTDPSPATQKTSTKSIMDRPPAQPPAGQVAIDALQGKYGAELKDLHSEGVARFHFVDYAPAAFVSFRDEIVLQATLRNPQTFDKDATSLYKRAARTFDLFLAPKLKGILEKIPESQDFNTVDFSIVLDLSSSTSGKSSEAVDFIFPLKATRLFARADITNQDLINQSVVLVNGVRISLNLAQVE